MSAAPEVINPQTVIEIAQCWNGVHLVRKDSAKGTLPAKLLSGDASSSSDELNTKVRKPYTITKQRERWTETEHQKFLEALKLYGRAWRRIEEYIGTKTAVQIRSHAQKFFSKLERGASTGSSGGKLPDIAIPPPRPKRKPNHPYPKKAGTSPPVLEDESKETSLLSSAGLGAALSDGFQPASVYPYTSQGLGGVVGTVAGGRFFRPQGSVKIFGKTVSFPKTNKASFPDDASYNRMVSEDIAVPAKQFSVAERKQSAGFSPFVKVRNLCVESFPEAPKPLDRDGSYSGTTQSEGTGESLGRTSGYDVAQENTEAANSVTFSDGECKTKDDVNLGKVESGLLAAGMQVSQLTNPAIHSWMNNLLHYHSGVSIPPIPGSVVGDGPANNSMSYWQFMQASAVSYAACTAAMAAVAAAGWKASNPGGTDQAESAKSNNNESNESQLPSAPPPWWPYSSFIPSVVLPLPADALQRGIGADTSKIAKALGSEKKDGFFEETPPQPDTGLKAAKVGEICEPALNVDCVTNDEIEDYTKTNSSAQTGSMFETSCRTEVSGFANGFPDSDSQRDAEAVFLPVKLCTQNSDTEKRPSPNSLQNVYSSSDEFEEQGKKQGERSSSGSNTPASRYESCEWDAPIIAESKKRDCCTLSENNDDSWNEAFQTSHQQCVTNTADFPKLRLKHAEKGRKHHQRDFRHDDDSKRFKSCAHEMELRKEVSQEGRKAFQALFTSKLLPQTFPSAGGRDFPVEDDYVSRSTVSDKDESRLNECIKFRRVFHESTISEGDNSNNAANLEMDSEFQGLDGLSAELSSKGFTVSSSSGFVPYRRLI